MGIGCEYLWCLPLKQKPLFSAMVQVSVDLDLGSSEISKSGLNIWGPACGPVGAFPGCLCLTPVRIPQPRCALLRHLSFPSLPLRSTIFKEKESQSSLESLHAGFLQCSRNCLNSFSPLLLLEYKEKKWIVNANKLWHAVWLEVFHWHAHESFRLHLPAGM